MSARHRRGARGPRAVARTWRCLPRVPRNRRSSQDPTAAPATKSAASAIRRCQLEGISDSRQGVNRRKPVTEARVRRPTMILTGKRHSQDGLKFRLAGEGKFRWG
jgi:hypothetical protein